MRNFVQVLESRTFLSVSPGFTGHPAATPPDATITADLNAIKTAQAALSAAWKADGTAIIADGIAVRAAIRTAQTSVPPALITQLKTDQTTVQTDLVTLFKDYATKASAAQITLDKAALTKAEGAVQTDVKTIQTIINTNPAVAAAEKKLASDSATVTADAATLQAAFKQLFTDLHNHA